MQDVHFIETKIECTLSKQNASRASGSALCEMAALLEFCVAVLF